MNFLNIKYSIWIFYYHGINSKSLKTVLNLLFGTGKYINIRLKKYPFPIKLRRKGSDLAVFNEVLLQSFYRFETSLAFTPRAIVDCGANIGLASIFFKALYPQSEIISVEPDEGNFKLMTENLQYYSNIHCLKSGIWSKDTYLSADDNNSTHCGYSFHESDSEQLGSVKAYSIDSIMKMFNLDFIDILKIDIEGAEKMIFEKDYNYWLSRTNIVIVELHDRAHEGCSKAFFKALVDYDFTTEVIGENIFCFFKR